MQGIDTNVLVRMIVDDDPDQCAAARAWASRLTPEAPGYVGLITSVEFIWVLQRTYGFARTAIIDTLRQLLNVPEIIFEDADDLNTALWRAEQSAADIVDALIVVRNTRAGCSDTVSFDRRAALHAGMTVLNTD